MQKIVIAVMLIDGDEKPEYYENVAVDVGDAVASIPQIQTWVSEQVICAKMKTIGLGESTQEERRSAPWTDYNGLEIFEGDTLVHSLSGERGVVVFRDKFKDPSDQWKVEYRDDVALRLCDQVGDKGQAVVVQP